jgi:hypothetical protein
MIQSISRGRGARPGSGRPVLPPPQPGAPPPLADINVPDLVANGPPGFSGSGPPGFSVDGPPGFLPSSQSRPMADAPTASTSASPSSQAHATEHSGPLEHASSGGTPVTVSDVRLSGVDGSAVVCKPQAAHAPAGWRGVAEVWATAAESRTADQSAPPAAEQHTSMRTGARGAGVGDLAKLQGLGLLAEVRAAALRGATHSPSPGGQAAARKATPQPRTPSAAVHATGTSTTPQPGGSSAVGQAAARKSAPQPGTPSAAGLSATRRSTPLPRGSSVDSQATARRSTPQPRGPATTERATASRATPQPKPLLPSGQTAKAQSLSEAPNLLSPFPQVDPSPLRPSRSQEDAKLAGSKVETAEQPGGEAGSDSDDSLIIDDLRLDPIDPRKARSWLDQQRGHPEAKEALTATNPAQAAGLRAPHPKARNLNPLQVGIDATSSYESNPVSGAPSLA